MNVGLCRAHFARRRIGAIGGVISPVMGFCAIIAGALWGTGWLILLGMTFLLPGSLCGFLASRVVTATKIDDHHVWLSGVDPAYLRMLPQIPTTSPESGRAGGQAVVVAR